MDKSMLKRYRKYKCCVFIDFEYIIFSFTGVGIAIVKDGEVYTTGFGLADIEGRRNFDADTIACGGSTGKFFTATLLAILMTEHNRRGKK